MGNEGRLSFERVLINVRLAIFDYEGDLLLYSCKFLVDAKVEVGISHSPEPIMDMSGPNPEWLGPRSKNVLGKRIEEYTAPAT